MRDVMDNDYFGEIAEILNTACDELRPTDFKKLMTDLTALFEYYYKLPNRIVAAKEGE